MRRLLTLIVVAILAAASSAQAALPRNSYKKYGTVVAAQTLASTRSFVVNLDQPDLMGVFGLATAWVCVADANNSVTALTMTCTSSPDGGTTDHTLQSCTTAAGVCTSSNASWTKDPSAITSPKCWPWRVDIEGMANLECSFANTGGTAADTINVILTFATK